MHSWRNRTAVSPERSPTEGTPLGCRSPMKVVENLRTTILYHHALVAQLDSVSASDAEGCGFDPRRVHQSPLLRGLLHSAGVRTHRSPDAEGGARAACGEVSPPGAPKPPFRGLLHTGRGAALGSPDAEGGARAACGEVSPPGAPKPSFRGLLHTDRGLRKFRKPLPVYTSQAIDNFVRTDYNDYIPHGGILEAYYGAARTYKICPEQNRAGKRSLECD